MIKNRCLTLLFWGSWMVIFFSTFAQAGSTPLWTFTPLTPTQFSIAPGQTISVRYLITNQSKKQHTIAMKAIPGVKQITAGNGVCPYPITLNAGALCTLELNAIGNLITHSITGGPEICQTTQDGGPGPFNCYRPSAPDALNITPVIARASLSVSATPASPLALAVNGNTRAITVSNTSDAVANNINYISSTLPEGTTLTSSCTSLEPNSSCTIMVTPGSNSSLDMNDTPCNAGGTAPISTLVTVNADNAPPVIAAFTVLNYGCIYQSGYVFSIDDTMPTAGSIHGKTAALQDQTLSYPLGVIWSSNGNGSTSIDVANDPIPGIYDNSTAPPDACNGTTDGSCNSIQILNYYPNITPSYYSAGICGEYQIDSSGQSPCQSGNICYTNWYLPSVCEMGYFTNLCHTESGPTTQNMQTNLYDNQQIGNLYGGSYWSSTEASENMAWYSSFQYNNQYAYSKAGQLTIRCTRAFS